ncbi:hypothetical protein LR48_Vigan11g034000 [Vigna angularis]|uniref:Uncharacterized protein n=1 Tax=Phaseolus angularis TaxID=3914 RepID=A0A0L9VQZ8_PHAAN|nr:hypothetical protein LR48_Vigan11g034000 [Vigna angularis]
MIRCMKKMLECRKCTSGRKSEEGDPRARPDGTREQIVKVLEVTRPHNRNILAPTVRPSDLTNSMVTTRNMRTKYPTKMIRMLQQKMEEMQQHHEEELAVVWTKCSARIAKEKSIEAGEKGEEERDKTTQGEGT